MQTMPGQTMSEENLFKDHYTQMKVPVFQSKGRILGVVTPLREYPTHRIYLSYYTFLGIHFILMKLVFEI